MMTTPKIVIGETYKACVSVSGRNLMPRNFTELNLDGNDRIVIGRNVEFTVIARHVRRSHSFIFGDVSEAEYLQLHWTLYGRKFVMWAEETHVNWAVYDGTIDIDWNDYIVMDDDPDEDFPTFPDYLAANGYGMFGPL